METLTKWDGLTRKYREVLVNNGYYTLIDGTPLFRIETKGKTGKSLYSKSIYLFEDGKEISAQGLGGSTGYGWGGSIVGYLTKEEIEKYPIKIK